MTQSRFTAEELEVAADLLEALMEVAYELRYNCSIMDEVHCSGILGGLRAAQAHLKDLWKRNQGGA